ATVLETDPVRVVQRPRAREGADEIVGAIEPVRSDLHRAPEGMIPVRVTGERPDASAVAEQDARNVAASVSERAGADGEPGAAQSGHDGNVPARPTRLLDGRGVLVDRLDHVADDHEVGTVAAT